MLPLTVADINTRTDLLFLSDSQDVQAIRDYFPGFDECYDSFFVKVENGEYTEIYGMEGIIPNLNKRIYKLIG